MDRIIEVDSDMKPMAYAWPGGYPIFYIARTGWREVETGSLVVNPYDRTESILCPECAGKKEDILIACDINYEDESLYCEGCGEQIEPAYGDDHA